MPIFVPDGPDIPEQLLHAQEEGRVVFFCGAGISVPAGLPLFGALVNKLFDKMCCTPDKLQQSAIKSKQYDVALQLLESNIGERQAVRKELKTILAPNLNNKDALTLHKAILTLGTDRNNVLRVVTTNYDYLFKIAATDLNHKSITEHAAPFLPIPKPSFWNGLVYLHGLLPEDNSSAKLESLVLSSSDFGRAYLTERWASRFITELFNHYTICFVGYSLNDAVMRYMVDAIAADRKCGDAQPNNFFSFVGCRPKDFKGQQENWSAKAIIPILYDSRGARGRPRHAKLYKTLEAWASIYKDGVSGKNRIIANFAANPPLSNLAKNDKYVGNVLWALTDVSAAKYFAEMKPAPPFEWIGPLSTPQFSANDLKRFGASPLPHETSLKREFSFFERPAPHAEAWVKFSRLDEDNYWDKLMEALGSWLLCHLNDPKLAIWLSRRGGRINPQFARRLEEKLYKEKEETERTDAPMRVIWDIFLSGRIGINSNFDSIEMYDIIEQICKTGLTCGLKQKLREALSPYVTLEPPYSSYAKRSSDKKTSSSKQMNNVQNKTLKEMVRYEVKLRSEHVRAALTEHVASDTKNNWINAQPELLPTYTLLLRDTLDLLKAFDEANEKSDYSFIYQPSIEKTEQNKHYTQWTELIELTREAWLRARQTNPRTAARIADEWWHTPYPLFKRLALFAAKHSDVVPQQTAIEWLLSEDTHWLWSFETQRELIRLLNSFGDSLKKNLLEQLETAILKGPSENLFKPGLTPEQWTIIKERGIWLRLAKLCAGGTALSNPTEKVYREISSRNSGYKLDEQKIEEFPFWVGDAQDAPPPASTPESCADLAEYISKFPDPPDYDSDDDWRIRCQRSFETPFCALQLLANEQKWPIGRWKSALYARAGKDEPGKAPSPDLLASVLIEIPDEAFGKLVDALAQWVLDTSKIENNSARDGENTSRGLSDSNITLLCKRILEKHTPSGSTETRDYISGSINHPIGKVVETLLATWCKMGVKDGQGINPQHRELFEKVFAPDNSDYIFGRTILYGQTELFYRVAPDWAKERLLAPLNRKEMSEEYRAAWEAFLFSPRLYPQLVAEIKAGLLNFVTHFSDFGMYANNYAAFMTLIALDPRGLFTPAELRKIFASLPTQGLKASISTLTRQFSKNDEQATDFWNNRIEPFFREIWPHGKTEDLSDELSRRIADFCIHSGKQFPNAMRLKIVYWIKPLENPGMLIRKMIESKLCEEFPVESLAFLGKIIKNIVTYAKNNLKECLEKIKEKNSELAVKPEYQRLLRLVE